MNLSTDGYRKKFIIACTGASGVIYFSRLIMHLCKEECELHIIISKSGKEVLAHEDKNYSGQTIIEFIKKKYPEIKIRAKIFQHNENDFFTSPASGSFIHDGMVIVPSSMKTLASIACGMADSLITRSADVALKERRKLVIVPREMPYNRIHLENMMKLTDAGAVILPASPAYYHHPKSIDELADSVVARIMNLMGINQNIMGQWKIDTH